MSLIQTTFNVTETFKTRLLGTSPASEELYQNFINKKRQVEEERRNRAAERLGTQVVEIKGSEQEELDSIREEAGLTIFHNNLGEVEESGQPGQGLHFLDYQIMGFWKEAAEALVGTHGIKQPRSKFDNFMFCNPRCCYITDQEGKVVTAPDGRFERPLRAMTLQGPRVSLASSEFLSPGRQVRYTVGFVPGLKEGSGKEAKNVDLEKLMALLGEYGSLKGRGQWRSGGNGRMEVKIEVAKA